MIDGLTKILSVSMMVGCTAFHSPRSLPFTTRSTLTNSAFALYMADDYEDSDGLSSSNASLLKSRRNRVRITPTDDEPRGVVNRGDERVQGDGNRRRSQGDGSYQRANGDDRSTHGLNRGIVYDAGMTAYGYF
mmetsp:Transcript_54359/g.63529  ORF Transcript_54359/g.63529 Transcript_54359/m.63529 type:complete len:133 (+) Transcript_54359:98-496(+)